MMLYLIEACLLQSPHFVTLAVLASGPYGKKKLYLHGLGQFSHKYYDLDLISPHPFDTIWQLPTPAHYSTSPTQCQAWLQRSTRKHLSSCSSPLLSTATLSSPPFFHPHSHTAPMWCQSLICYSHCSRVQVSQSCPTRLSTKLHPPLTHWPFWDQPHPHQCWHLKRPILERWHLIYKVVIKV